MIKNILPAAGLGAFLIGCSLDPVSPEITGPEIIVRPDTVYISTDTNKVSFPDISFNYDFFSAFHEPQKSWVLMVYGDIFNEGSTVLRLRPRIRLYNGRENFETNNPFSDTQGHLGTEPDYENYVLKDSTDILPAFSNLDHITFSEVLDWEETDFFYRFSFQFSDSNGLNKRILTLEGRILSMPKELVNPLKLDLSGAGVAHIHDRALEELKLFPLEQKTTRGYGPSRF